jgi:GntR family transcriptional regulator
MTESAPMSLLDRSSPLPLYVQISDQIRRQIGDGTIHVRDLSDSRLTTQFGVSRMTVRQALEQLRKEGLLEREQGKGTRLAKPVEGQLSKMERFFSEWSVQGAEVSTRLLSRSVVPADADVARVLNVARKTPVGVFRRIRFIDDQAICLDVRYLRAELLQQLNDDELLRTADLVLQDKLGTVITKAEIRISAIAAAKHQAKALGVDVGAPLLLRFMELYSVGGRGILCGPSYFRSDLFAYRVTVTS